MPNEKASNAFSGEQILTLVVSAIFLFVAVGALFLMIVALKDVAAEFAWPREIPSLAITLQFVGSGIGGILLGYLLDRYGMSLPAFVCLAAAGLGAILISHIDAKWQLYTIYLFMFGLSGPTSAVTPAMMNVAKWFDKGRAMAIGIVASGQGLAGILWPLIFGWVIEDLGWRKMFFWYGVFALITTVPIWFVLRRKPSANLMKSMGQSTGPTDTPRRLSANTIQAGLCCAILGCCVAMGLPLGHLIAYVTDLGYSVGHAAMTLSVTQISGFLSSAILVGVFAGRFGGLPALFIFSGTQALMLAALTATHQLWLLYVISALLGIGYGGIFPAYAVIIREHLPASQAGMRAGIVFLFGAVAMGIGGWLGGFLFDLTGSYTTPFLIGVGFNLANLIVVVALTVKLRPPMPTPAMR